MKAWVFVFYSCSALNCRGGGPGIVESIIPFLGIRFAGERDAAPFAPETGKK
jgi:hypothetical protein